MMKFDGGGWFNRAMNVRTAPSSWNEESIYNRGVRSEEKRREEEKEEVEKP